MVDSNRLKGLIVNAGFSQRSFASHIGMNKDTFNLKINNKSDFKTGEIEKICDALHIVKSSDKVDIFLCKPSQKCNT
ncbi:MAG: helix-turn-helix domain-containing protein [Eubacterium sp.]